MAQEGETGGWRKTVFTTCMEGAWTGVGHREMVWCHQVRWRVARAAMELGNSPSETEKGAILGRWFRDEVNHDYLHQNGPLRMGSSAVTHIPSGQRLMLRPVPLQSGMYLLPLAPGLTRHSFILYVSHGAVGSLSPHHASELHASVLRCHLSTENCFPLWPHSLKLIPNPLPGTPFPVSGKGVDESDGVVRFEATLDTWDLEASNVDEWIGVDIRGGGDLRSWMVAGIEQERVVMSEDSVFGEIVLRRYLRTLIPI